MSDTLWGCIVYYIHLIRKAWSVFMLWISIPVLQGYVAVRSRQVAIVEMGRGARPVRICRFMTDALWGRYFWD
jgi:hypothetical protein